MVTNKFSFAEDEEEHCTSLIYPTPNQGHKAFLLTNTQKKNSTVAMLNKETSEV